MSDELYKKMVNSHNKHLRDVKKLEQALSKTITFDFSIICQPGDGFCILEYKSARLAGVHKAIKFCKEGKKYTEDDHDGSGL